MLSASTGVEAVPPLSRPLFLSASSLSSSGIGIFVCSMMIFLLLCPLFLARSFLSSAARIFANLSGDLVSPLMRLLVLLLSCILLGSGDELFVNFKILEILSNHR